MYIHTNVLYELRNNVLRSLFGEQQITESCYSAVYTIQNDVIKAALAKLNSDSPKISLVLSNEDSCMGFNPPPVNRCRGCLCTSYTGSILARCGQASIYIVYYSKRDIASILPGISAFEQKYNK